MWVLLILLGLVLLGLVIWALLWTNANFNRLSAVEAKDMVLMGNVTDLDMRLVDEATSRLAKDMILMGNVTDLEMRLMDEEQARMIKDMILMGNITSIEASLADLGAFDVFAIEQFMIKMGNITDLSDRIDAEELARIVKDMTLMTDLATLDAETVKSIEGQVPDGAGNVDLVGGVGVSVIPGPGPNQVSFINDGIVTLESVAPDAGGNVDLVGIGIGISTGPATITFTANGVLTVEGQTPVGGNIDLSGAGSVSVSTGAPGEVIITGGVVGLANAGTTTLVNDGVGPTLALKGLVAGTNMLAFGVSATDVTINAATVTLANAGTTTLVNDGTGQALALKGLIAGANMVAFGVSATDVTINAATVTLTNAGTTSLVNDGTGPALGLKGMVAGIGIGIATSAIDVTVNNMGVVTLEGVGPDGAGNVDLIPSGIVTITPGVNSITFGAVAPPTGITSVLAGPSGQIVAVAGTVATVHSSHHSADIMTGIHCLGGGGLCAAWPALQWRVLNPFTVIANGLGGAVAGLSWRVPAANAVNPFGSAVYAVQVRLDIIVFTGVSHHQMDIGVCMGALGCLACTRLSSHMLFNTGIGNVDLTLSANFAISTAQTPVNTWVNICHMHALTASDIRGVTESIIVNRVS